MKSRTNQSAKKQDQNWTPNLDNMPKNFVEWLDHVCLFGLPVLIFSVITLIPLPVTFLNPHYYVGEHNFWTHACMFTYIFLIFTIWPLIQLPFILLAIPLFPWTKKNMIQDWARHGYYREGFEPKGYDLGDLSEVTQAEVGHVRENYKKNKRR